MSKSLHQYLWPLHILVYLTLYNWPSCRLCWSLPPRPLSRSSKMMRRLLQNRKRKLRLTLRRKASITVSRLYVRITRIHLWLLFQQVDSLRLFSCQRHCPIFWEKLYFRELRCVLLRVSELQRKLCSLLCIIYQVTKRVWAYIKEHDLQNPADRREILCDERMEVVMNRKKIKMFKMTKVLSEVCPVFNIDR